MKIIRWLLSHSFLILLIVLVIYGYMFWGNLAGKDTPVGKVVAYLSNEFVEVDEFVNAVKAKQAQLTSEQPSDNKAQTSEESVATATLDEQENAAELTGRNIEQPPVSISYSHNSSQVEQNSAGTVEAEKIAQQAAMANVASNEPSQNKDASLQDRQRATTRSDTQLATNALASNDTKEVFVSPDIEKQLSKVDEGSLITDKSQKSSAEAVRETWITARKSFYQRNYELSEQSYQKVIDSTENNFDAYGELGNVYFNQGKNKQAAAAYYEAAAILVRKGQANRARSLMGLLRHLDKTKADELQKLIDSNLS